MGKYKSYLGPILTIYASAGEELIEIKCFTEHSLYALHEVLENNGYSVHTSRFLSSDELEKKQEKFEALNPVKVLKQWFMKLNGEDQHALVIHVDKEPQLLGDIDEKAFNAFMISSTIDY